MRLSACHPLTAPLAALGWAGLLLQAVIDQVEGGGGLITFRAAAPPLGQWDRNVAGLCQAVNGIVEGAATRGIQLPAAAAVQE